MSETWTSCGHSAVTFTWTGPEPYECPDPWLHIQAILEKRMDEMTPRELAVAARKIKALKVRRKRKEAK